MSEMLTGECWTLYHIGNEFASKYITKFWKEEGLLPWIESHPEYFSIGLSYGSLSISFPGHEFPPPTPTTPDEDLWNLFVNQEPEVKSTGEEDIETITPPTGFSFVKFEVKSGKPIEPKKEDVLPEEKPKRKRGRFGRKK